MKGFMEEGAWTSCSFDLAGTPQEMQKSSDRLVTYSRGDRLLTVKDKTTKDCFACKAPAKFWGGLATFLGGLAVGAALVLSGPVGWIALGAVVAVGVAVSVSVIVHDCSDPQESGAWKPFHKKALIKGKEAILYQYSMLTCKKGGIMIASETKVSAQNVSDQMKWNTRGELGVQILSQAAYGFVSGYMLGKGAGPAAIAYTGITSTFFYGMGESDNETASTAGTIIEWVGFNGFVEKYKALFEANDATATTGGTFGKAFAKAYLPGIGAAIATMVVDHFVNKFEDSLQADNMGTIKSISKSKSASSSKSIVSATN